MIESKQRSCILKKKVFHYLLRILLLRKKHAPAPSRPLQEAFNLMERETVDLKLTRGLCSAGIPFNALRNPEFVDMLVGVNKAPKGCKPPSYE